MMKDVALVKTGASGEYAVNKFQDFQYDPELFDFCELPQVKEKFYLFNVSAKDENFLAFFNS